MAFTGSATIKKVANDLIRITGLSLAASAAGTICLAGATGEVDLLTVPEWGAYAGVTLQDAVQISYNFVTDVSGYDEALRIVKTGTTQADFLITMTNDDSDVATPQMEIYVRFH